MRKKALVGLVGLLIVAAIAALALDGGGDVPTDGAEPAAAEASGGGSGRGRPGSDASSMAIDSMRSGDGVGAPSVSGGSTPGSSGGSSSDVGPGRGDGSPVPPLPSPEELVNDAVDDLCTEAEKAETAKVADESRAELEAQIAYLQSEIDGLTFLVGGQVAGLQEDIAGLEQELAALDELEQEALAVCEAGGDGTALLT